MATCVAAGMEKANADNKKSLFKGSFCYSTVTDFARFLG